MKNRAQGMTLIELMIAILIVAILMSMAVPSFRQFAADSRTTAATSDLVTALNVARSEALRRGTQVVACASANLAQCSDSTTWSTGWIVFADEDGDGAVDADELVQTWTSPGGSIAVTSTANRAVYNSMGMATPAQEATFTIKLTGCTGEHAKQTVMSASGSLQTKKKDC
jgi:type IV fimbrial biogenesis protein FimT